MWWRTEWEGQKQPQRPSTGQSQIYQDERFGSWAECFYITGSHPSLRYQSWNTFLVRQQRHLLFNQLIQSRSTSLQGWLCSQKDFFLMSHHSVWLKSRLLQFCLWTLAKLPDIQIYTRYTVRLTLVFVSLTVQNIGFCTVCLPKHL